VIQAAKRKARELTKYGGSVNIICTLLSGKSSIPFMQFLLYIIFLFMASNSDWLTPAFNEMYRVLENNRYAVVFYGWNEVDKFVNAWRKAGFRIIGQLLLAISFATLLPDLSL
jgi:DNA modification methylase